MNWKEIKGLKYYIAYATFVVGFFVYSGAVGWKWFNPTKTENERSTGRGHTSRGFIYHK